MSHKPLDLPMQIAKAFVKDMRAYFAEPNTIKRDEIRIFVIGAMLALSPMAAQAAATCDEFEAAMIEGAAQHQAPPPKFQVEHVNLADVNIEYLSITMFDDVRGTVSCSYGDVGTFMVVAATTEPLSVQHTMLMAGIGLHAYGLELRLALQLKDQLVSLAKASDTGTAKVHVGGGEASLVLSAVGAPSFEIDSDR